MNSKTTPRNELFFGIVLMLGGCLFFALLIFAIMTTTVAKLTIFDVLSCICLFLFILILFIASAYAFIKYGMLKGIDYCLDKEYFLDKEK